MDPNLQPKQPVQPQPIPPQPEYAPTPKLQAAQMFAPTPGQQTLPGQQPLPQQPDNSSPVVTQSNNPYEFITSPAVAPKKANPFSTGILRGKLMLIIGGALVLAILIIAGSSLLGGKGKNNVANLQSLLAQQQEIIRIATYGVTESRDANTLNLATTTIQSITSDKVKLQKYLVTKKVETTPVQIAAKKDKATDEKLAAAQQQNNFDPIFVSTLIAMLNTYMTDAQAAYDDAANPESKRILADSYNSIEILVKFYGSTAAH